jgi:hypothetical protein
MRENEMGRAAAKELASTKKLCDTALRNRDSAMGLMRSQINDYKDLGKTKDDRINVAYESAEVNKNWALSEHKLYTKQKRKTVLVIIGAAILESATIYFLAK